MDKIQKQMKSFQVRGKDNAQRVGKREVKVKTEQSLEKEGVEEITRLEEMFPEEQAVSEWSDKHEERATALNDLTNDYEDDSLTEYSSESQESNDDPLTMEQLSDAIYAHALARQQSYSQAQQQFQPLCCHLFSLGLQLGLRLEVIGSFAHGLWTGSSDIDLAFVNTKPNPIDVPATLHTIYKSLRQHEKALEVHNIYLNKQSHATKFPNINLELNSSSNPHQRVDIIIFQRSNNGVKYVNWVNGWNMYPFFKPLFFILRGVLEKFQLHCQAKGGIKTYTLINMLSISLSHYGFQSLGDSLMQFCWHFSSVFEYEEKVNEQGECQTKMNLIDPLNSTNNIGGKHTDITKLKAMLKTIYYGLKLCKGKTDPIQYLFSLNHMFEA